MSEISTVVHVPGWGNNSKLFVKRPNKPSITAQRGAPDSSFLEVRVRAGVYNPKSSSSIVLLPHMNPGLLVRERDASTGYVWVDAKVTLQRQVAAGQEDIEGSWEAFRGWKKRWVAEYDSAHLYFKYKWNYEWTKDGQLALRKGRLSSNKSDNRDMLVLKTPFHPYPQNEHKSRNPYLKVGFQVNGPHYAKTRVQSIGPFLVDLKLLAAPEIKVEPIIEKNLLKHTVYFNFDVASLDKKVTGQNRTEAERLHDWRDRISQSSPDLKEVISRGWAPLRGECHASQPASYGYNRKLTDKRREATKGVLSSLFGSLVNFDMAESLSDRRGEDNNRSGPSKVDQVCEIMIDPVQAKKEIKRLWRELGAAQ